MKSSSDSWTQIARGVSEIISEAELKAKLAKGKTLRIKLGVDPTAPDLHLGHLVLLRKLRAFQDLGHTIEFIIGDFTARIGDPSGQSVTRPTLKPQEIWENSKTYQDQVFKVIAKDKTEVRFNSTWLNALGISGLLELQRHATVAQMLHRADFAKRFEEGTDISLLELVYPVLQGYDSVAVQADIELGGSDQKFNLLMGREIQQDYHQEPQVVMMMPLLEGLDGVRKMSKSYGNYVAFNDSPKDMFGKIMSIPDALMEKYALLLTDLDWKQLKGLHPREAKEQIAKTLTAQFHGVTEANKAAQEFERVFTKREVPTDIEEKVMDSKQPQILAHVLAHFGYAKSRKEAWRLIEQKAVEVDDQIADHLRTLEFDRGQVYRIRVGKKCFFRLRSPD